MNNYIRDIRILFWIILTAVLIMTFVFCLIQAPDFSQNIEFNSTALIVLLIVLLLIFSSVFLFKYIIRKKELLPDRLRTAYIVRLACLEAASTLSLIMYLLEDSLFYLLLVLLIVLCMLSIFPSSSKIKSLLSSQLEN